MFKFQLDPPSGYADSYADIKFIATFDNSDRIELELINDSINSKLEILSIDKGYISNETTAIGTKCDNLTGYINIFNKDKMNTSLRNLPFVNITCKACLYRGPEKISEEVTHTFYNQSQSADGDIVPFDIVVSGKTIDVANNNHIVLYVISGESKRYELSIQSKDKKNTCFFEVLAKKGKTEVNLPIELLYSDLELEKNHSKSFDVYWTKFEGITHTKYMNRKYVKIDGSELHSNSDKLIAKKQNRNGPIGRLPNSFILSDRYLVHTWQNFSGFHGQANHKTKRLDYLTRFMFESQSMGNPDLEKVELFSSNKDVNISESQKATRKHSLYKKMIGSKSQARQNMFVETFSQLYEPKDSDQKSTHIPSTVKQESSKKQGCGCSRKNK